MARSVSLAGGVGQGTVIRVAIVADIRLYREGLARILERQPNISVVATAATSDGSLAPLSQLAPDLILIDMAMPDSPAAIRRVAVAAPGAKVVSLSVREGEDHGDVLASAEAGAIAYVPREASLEDLVAVIECAVRGEAVCSPRVAGALLRRIAALATDGRSDRVQAHLTSREREHPVVAEVALRHPPALDGDLPVQRRGQAEHDRSLQLRLDRVRVDEDAAVGCAHHAVHPHPAVRPDGHLGHLGQERLAELPQRDPP